MADYAELVKNLRITERICRDRMDGQVMLDAADAIEELEKKMLNWQATADDHWEAYQHWFHKYMDDMPKWIPVTERLPIGADDSGALCENVCLMMDDGTVSCGWMNGVTKRVYYLNARDDFVIKAPITRVTHWMPLPEPPVPVMEYPQVNGITPTIIPASKEGET